MRAELILILMLLPFLSLLWLAYRWLKRVVLKGVVNPLPAIMTLWGMIVVLPWVMLLLYVPLANSLFMRSSVLQTPSWDVGLAISLWLGTVICYMVGAVAGIFATIGIRRATVKVVEGNAR